MVFKYSTDALVWYSNSTSPFPGSSHGSARKVDETKQAMMTTKKNKGTIQ